MAEDDLVTVIKVEGSAEAVAEILKVGSAGQQMGEQLDGGAKKATQSIAQVEAASKKFGESLRGLGSAVSNTASNIGKLAATGAKWFTILAGGIAAINRFNAAQAQSDTDSKLALKSLQQTSKSNIEAANTVRQHARAWDDLHRTQSNANSDAQRTNQEALEDLQESLRKREISQEEYTKQLAKLERQQERERSNRFREQQRAQNELRQAQAREIADQKAQASAREAEEADRIRASAALQKQAAAQKQYAANVQAFGSDTANALEQFGSAWDRFMNLLNEGPSTVADILRAVAQFITTNGAEIVATFNKIGDAIAKAIFGENAGDPTKMSKQIMDGFRAVSTFILETFIPAVKSVVGFFEGIAQSINSVFGTKLTGPILLIGTIIFGLIGGFSALVAIISVLSAAFGVFLAVANAASLTPIGLAIRLIIIAIIALIGYLATLNWKEIWAQAQKAVEDVGRGFQIFYRNAVQTFNDLVAFVKSVPGKILGYFTDLWARIVADAEASWEQFKTFAVNALAAIAQAIVRTVPGLETLIGWIKKGAAAWNEYNAAKKQGEGEGATQSKAGGGMVFGAGTSTSDSILARLSNGEFVVRAAAVRKYGSRLLHQINSLNFGGFAEGGLVDLMGGSSLAPSFAGGGDIKVARASGTKRPIILQFADGNEFQVEATGRTADSIGRYASKRRLASSGRKPSYIGS